MACRRDVTVVGTRPVTSVHTALTLCVCAVGIVGVAGASIPGQSKSILAPHVRARHHVWDGSVCGRQRAMPHMKSFLRYRVDER